MTIDNEIKSRITGFMAAAPRHEIVAAPTPLVRLDRLSEHLGIDLWIKRDDLAGLSFGGNKSRQLEYYFGAALAADADTVLITGAVQSNFVRTAAAEAARLGMHAVVQLEERVETDDALYRSSGNVMLNHMLGAEIITYHTGEDETGADDALYVKAEELRKAGRRPYVIPLGEKPPIGALGYIRCIEETIAQTAAPFDEIITASGSGTTHIGLVAGAKLAGLKARITGSCVRRTAPEQMERLTRMAGKFNDLVGVAGFLGVDDFNLWDGALSPGYGKISKPGYEAMQMMAQYEGQILDPIYTAKSFAAVIALARSGEIARGARVLYIHTGGLAAVFAYQQALAEWA